MVPEKIKQPPLILILGRRGIGKSYLSADLARSWPLAHVWTFNPRSDKHLNCFPRFDFERKPPLENSLLVFDEFSMVCRPNFWRMDWLEDVVSQGRHCNVGIIANVQRPQKMHVDCQALFTRAYIGHTTKKKDLVYMADFLGDAVFDAINLPPRKFIEIIA